MGGIATSTPHCGRWSLVKMIRKLSKMIRYDIFTESSRKAVKMAGKRVLLTIDEGLLEKIENACKASGISKSAYFSSLAAKDLTDTKEFLESFKVLLDEALEKVK